MSSRRALDVQMDDQAAIAANHLMSLEANKLERMEVNYPLASLKPSPSNPRRISLDNAGVNAEAIETLSIKRGETLAAWSDRLDAFLDTLESKGTSAKSFSVWSEMFDLAISIYTTDLLQPIVAKIDGEIIAGERRWTASALAGKSHGRVILRQVAANMEHLFRLIENIRRSDLSVAETAMSLRLVMETKTGIPCAPDNIGLSIQNIQELIGVGQTQSAYYRAICRLPEDDPLLTQIISGAYNSLRTAYEDANRRLREIKVIHERAGTGEQAGLLDDLGVGTRTSTSSGTSSGTSTSTSTSTARRDIAPTLKARMPGTKGGLRFYAAIEHIDGVSDETLERIKAIRAGWAGAPDKARKKMLAEALEKIFSDLDQLDEDGQ